MSLRLVFMGSPDFAVPSLMALAQAGHEIAAVYTQPPKPAGRGKTLRKTPVHLCAESLGLNVLTPATLKDKASQDELADLKADLFVVVAYGLLLPKSVLDMPQHGCFNLHASLLPRWRGAAPIQRAIMAGDQQTGAQIMRMERGLDTGPILLSETLPISPDDTSASLHERLSILGADLWPRALAALERGGLFATPQASQGVLYAKKISKEEARLDWTESAVNLDRKIRGLSPFPGAWFMMETPQGSLRVKALMSRVETPSLPSDTQAGTVLEKGLLIACGDGALRLLKLQRHGKKPMMAEDFLRGTPLSPGDRLR